MSDKTCGTCAHCADRHGTEQPMASHVCMHMGTLIIDPERPNCAGLYYEERTDSVEQLAADLYQFTCSCGGAEYGSCHKCEYGERREGREWACTAPNRFRRRFEALGVGL